MRGMRFSALLLCLSALCVLPVFSRAEPLPVFPAPPAPEAAREIPALPPVPVIGIFSNPATGRSVMEGAIIDRLPSGNGSINEILRAFPDVQAAESSRTGAEAAEIFPPVLSISGGKTFGNNFLIDGFRNDSLLDPASPGLTGVNDAPGHPQALFLDAALVEKLTVHDSNVPAAYGGFTGGVVEAETRRPGPRPGGKVHYRTTRSDWTRFHLAEGEEEPSDFRKHQGGAELEIPLRPGMGVLASYRQLYSRIPQRHLGASDTQVRRKEDYFLKYVWEISDGTLDLSVASTPYEGKHFLPNVADSDFSVRQGGSQVLASLTRYLPLGELRLQGGYQYSRNSREAPADLLAWAVTDSRPWGALAGTPYSNQGGFGDIERTQETVGLRASFAAEPVRTGYGTHAPEAGVALETIRGTFRREETARIYTGAMTESNVICGEDTVACIDEEQYFTSRRVYPESSVSARINLADLYLQDEMRIGRLMLRPGVRLSYDDFMENLNAAPRLAATCDLFGDGATVLVGGANRYYGRTLLTYKLKEGELPPLREYRGIFMDFPNPWEPSPSGADDVSRFSRLDTPYSDELTAGVDQALAGGRLSLKYVRRDNEDEFARNYGERGLDGLRVSTLTNRGRSRHESVRLTWERSWRRHFLSFNVTWQETTASNESYDAILNEEDVEDRVWYRGRIIQKTELPRTDFNRPWMANLTYVGDLPYGFSFANIARYRSGYRGPVDTRTSRPVPGGEGRLDPRTGEAFPETLAVYEEKKLSGGVVFDWALRWRSPGRRSLLLSLEVDNVFDSRLETGAVRSTYETGRQFWASAAYRF